MVCEVPRFRGPFGSVFQGSKDTEYRFGTGKLILLPMQWSEPACATNQQKPVEKKSETQRFFDLRVTSGRHHSRIRRNSMRNQGTLERIARILTGRRNNIYGRLAKSKAREDERARIIGRMKQ